VRAVFVALEVAGPKRGVEQLGRVEGVEAESCCAGDELELGHSVLGDNKT